MANEGETHYIIKQSRTFSHFLSIFCSYCVISCTEDRHYCQIFAPEFFGDCHVCDRANSDSTRIFLLAWDGDKFVCMDSYSPENCLIYSFGIRLNSFFVSSNFDLLTGLLLQINNKNNFRKENIFLSTTWDFEDIMDQLMCKVSGGQIYQTTTLPNQRN